MTDIIRKEKEAQLKKEIEVYNFLHKIDSHSNYGLNQHLTKTEKTQKMAEFLNITYDKLSVEEMRGSVVKLMTENEIKSKLLKFELEHFTQSPKDMSLAEFIKEATLLFKRYQSKAGGFSIEDDTWTLYNSESDSRSVLQNEVVFENSVSKYDMFNEDTTSFIDLISNRLNSLSDQIKVTKDAVLKEEDGVLWIHIKCTHIGLEKETPLISL